MKDVIVIGGGVVGLCCAWELNAAGLEVTVVDRGDFTEGCSYANAGMVTPSHFIPLASPGIIAKGLAWLLSARSPFYIRPRLDTALVRWLWLFYRSANRAHGQAAAPLFRDMATESRDWYAAWQHKHGGDIGFESKGIVMLYRTASAEQDELHTAELAHALGIEANALSPEGLTALDPGCRYDVLGGVHYPGDAHLQPDRLMKQLKRQLGERGVSFYAGFDVARIDDNGQAGAVVTAADGSKMATRHVVLAAGAWSSSLVPGYRLPLQDGKGYSVTIARPEAGPAIPSILHEARVAITPMGDRLRIGGTLEISGFDGSIRQAKVDGILSAVPDYLPYLDIRDPGPVWHGYRPCSPDGLPYIGRARKGSAVILAAGHAMLGTGLAPATGRYVTDVVLGRSADPQYARLLDPGRFG